MKFTRLLVFIISYGLAESICYTQSNDSLLNITGYILDEKNVPLAYSHIINFQNGRGTTSGQNGNFELRAFYNDSILFRNVAYEELILIAGDINAGDTIHMKIRLFAIKEVKIFEWGSSYNDFKAKMMSMPVTESWGEKLGLPMQSGNPVPNYRNPEALSNPLFAITNPVDFLYFNLNKNQQSIRKVMEFKENELLIRRFESVYNSRSISLLTGLAGEELERFLIYLNVNFQCDFNCNEIQIVTEIYNQWKKYCGKEEK